MTSASGMNWDDLRYVLALSTHGSLAKTAKTLGVDHTTVGRRVEQAERSLGVRLFTRTTTGYVPTADAERLLADLRGVEDAVMGLERSASARKSTIDGSVRVTGPETFGCLYLAPRLATLRREHPGLSIELHSTGKILDLARREADVAVRMFRSPHESLVVKRVGTLGYGLYASKEYLARRPIKRASELRDHALLSSEASPGALDAKWLDRLAQGAKPALVCDLSMALLEACRASAGIAVLPRYVGDPESGLVNLTTALGPIPEPPTETIWITVHKDLRETPRVRVVLDHLAKTIAADSKLLVGR